MTSEIDTASGPLPVHEWGSADTEAPGVLLLQEIFGVSDYIKQRAADLHALGYYVIAPEIYWRLDDTELDESSPELLPRAMGIVGRLDWDQAVKDSVAALEYLKARGRGTGVVGFCFGGGLGYNVAAVSSPDVLVSYYGSALPGLVELAPKVTTTSLHHFGDAWTCDPSLALRQPAADVPPRRGVRGGVAPYRRLSCPTPPNLPRTSMSLYDIPLTTLSGAATSLGEYKGKAVLVVNVASKCGLTPQYEGLENLQKKYASRGFTVLGAPCNQFGGQEPGSAEEIDTFCSTTYGVTFPMLDKLEVNGEGRHPLYDELTQTPDAEGESGDIQWNFEKFLISPEGTVAARFRPRTEPESDEVVTAIESQLPKN